LIALDAKGRRVHPESDVARAARETSEAGLVRLADELDLAKHLADSLDAGSWVVADYEERDRLLQFARAALAWGVTPPIEQQNRFGDGFQAGWQAAVKEAAKAVKNIRRPSV
jgi:hypothetical protein